jgi:5-methyltetrahydrofolate--homocysteine methyltransferase
METRISGAKAEVTISDTGPTIIIGERINPTGKKKMSEALRAGNLDLIRNEALAQLASGAHVLDINVVTSGVNEVELLPRAVAAVMEVVDVPLCIDINDPAALHGALRVYEGKAIINSVSGEEKSLKEVLPIVKEYGTAVIGLTIGDKGIPKSSGERLEIARRIVSRAEDMGIPREDVIIDALSLSLGSDDQAGWVTLETIAKVKQDLGVNQTLGASNISFGLPDRPLINRTFLALAIGAGITCPTVDAEKVASTISAIDLILGRDRFAQRFLKDYRRRQET